MTRVTRAALIAAGANPANADAILHDMAQACEMYRIDTPARIAAFLAQCGHESMSFQTAVEIWGPTPAQRRYEGRLDLGNTQPGDGSRYRGRGYIQTTGRANHARVRDRLSQRLPAADVPDFEARPEMLAQLPWACLSATDYWDMRGLNALADAGDFASITRRINGGMNGHEDRVARWERVKAVMHAQTAVPVPAPKPAPQSPSTPIVTHQPEQKWHWLQRLFAALFKKGE